MPTTTKRCRSVALLAVLLLSLVAASSPAEQHEAGGDQAAESDPWGPLKLLEGSWRGEIDGKLGTGEGVRRYELILGDQYLLRRHVSVRLPQEKSPKGDQHEELGIYSYDSQANRTGITMLITALAEAGIRFRDLHTDQSSLEDIFVDLVNTKQ